MPYFRPGALSVSQTDVIAAHEHIRELRDLVNSGQFPRGPGLRTIDTSPVVWSSQGVAVAASRVSLGMGTPGLEGVSVLLVTPYADALSWLFQRLEIILANVGPAGFMRRLGEAAYWHQEDEPDDTSTEGILDAVLAEASAVLRELVGDGLHERG